MSVNYATGLSKHVDKGKCGQPEIHDDPEKLEHKIREFIDLFKKSKYIVVLTGAGISTSAGIPDFRGPKGVWTLEEKNIEPKLDITFESAIPTFTHRALTALKRKGLVQYVISQNVDGLHARSAFPLDSLAELHGNMFTEVCSHCRTKVSHCMEGGVSEKRNGRKYDFETNRKSLFHDETKRGHLVDTVLDWEDSLPSEDLKESEKQCRKADLCICLGTTLQIAPSGDLPLICRRAGGKFVLINLQKTKHDRTAEMRISTYVDDVMTQLCEELNVTVDNRSTIEIDIGISKVIAEDIDKY